MSLCLSRRLTRLLYFSHTPSVNQKALPCKVAQNTVSANHMLCAHARRSRSMSARAHPARHLSIAKTQTRALNKCAKGEKKCAKRSVESPGTNILANTHEHSSHKHSSESKSVSLSFSLQHALVCVCVCMARSRLKLAVLALGRTRGRGGVTGCWQIRLLSAMQAPVKQATLMSQKNNWRLPPAICCPHSSVHPGGFNSVSFD